ncbi:DUF1674 domain-containing protein [Tardiphaga sp. vice352]|uniref:DUF1674 domain-containing protein n=1 Tax=unclassified Tardiphaga TaxID=2631404 RepID=UPI001162DC6B|nr:MULTISPECIES: DUF1674 domain-containing protein [unclassified Tardiphaga]MBC7585599.1 DUF1674 domain-containing protein [Tardiphaga sp.]QDM14809.1 DUF1674 domain-containing protein [Tardiphaga sp. vice278]QDM19916.1 DUF1674 domain-containing protein [Tardiphaga sp. vice154]QDM30200.1 DUF1674 domain-containing protein [Tardiphaga sp. vice352]
MTDTSHDSSSNPAQAAEPEPAPKKILSPAAQRALAEAEARHVAKGDPERLAKELQGPAGPEPTRYGDWERKGIASDF